MTARFDVAVIGAGAAGLLAGIAAARAGARVVLLERNRQPGRKLALAGGGRCNFTNTLPVPQFLRCFGDSHARHLGQALRAFSNQDIRALLAARGVLGQEERDHRVFVRSGRGADAAEALVAELLASGATLVTDARVVDLTRNAGTGLFEVAVAPQGAPADAALGPVQYSAASVVLCTGGTSYPQTGSTGDGHTWARRLGHTVTPLRPGLVGLHVAEAWPRQLSGTAWPDARVELRFSETDRSVRPTLAVERGELLFAHFGVSGPAILNLSLPFVRSGLERAALTLDFFPDLSGQALAEQVAARLREQPRRSVAAALAGLLPRRLLEALVGLAAGTRETTGAEVRAAHVTADLRRGLLGLLKATALTVTGTRDIRHAEVTVGGVDWAELDPATLESRLTPGLFLAGEILDLAGRCGGFNLQAAFSTGFLAGRSAARFRP